MLRGKQVSRNVIFAQSQIKNKKLAHRKSPNINTVEFGERELRPYWRTLSSLSDAEVNTFFRKRCPIGNLLRKDVFILLSHLKSLIKVCLAQKRSFNEIKRSWGIVLHNHFLERSFSSEHTSEIEKKIYCSKMESTAHAYHIIKTSKPVLHDTVKFFLFMLFNCKSHPKKSFCILQLN